MIRTNPPSFPGCPRSKPFIPSSFRSINSRRWKETANEDRHRQRLQASHVHHRDVQEQGQPVDCHQLLAFVSQRIAHKEHISVLVGYPWRNFILEEAGVHDADVFISLSEKDTDNYASCILAKKIFNVKKCICVVNNPPTSSSIRNSASIRSSPRPIFWPSRSGANPRWNP
jgi:hypothetical protein